MSSSVHVGFFSTQPYDVKAFEEYHSDDVRIDFFDAQLNEKTVSLCKNYNAVCVFVNDQLDDQVISKLSSLGVKHIALRCAGYNNVDMDSAHSNGIIVSRVPAYSPETVAEHALALILTLNRKLHKAHNRVREGNFNLNGLLGFTLHGKTAGVVGTGKIGEALCRILLGFGCRVLCYDPFPKNELIKNGCEYVELDRLFSESRIVSLHCPLTDDSYHMINADSINHMQKGVMLINTSRGGLVDTQAVIEGLKSHTIGSLGLDVYEMESELFFKDHSNEIIHDDQFERLSTFHNVLITGHQGFFTQEAMAEISQTTINNLFAVHTGKLNSDNIMTTQF